MKSIHPPSKLKALMLGVLSSLSVYSMAAVTICPAIDGCEFNPSENNSNKIVIAAGQYRNGIPTVEEFKKLFNEDDVPGDTYLRNLTVLNIGYIPESTTLGQQVEFSPNTEIIVDSSFLNNAEYGPFRQDIEYTGVRFNSEKGTTKFVIPKGVHFSLQGQPKELEFGITGVSLDGGYLNSNADFSITAPNSNAYDIGWGTADISNSVINLGKNSDFSTAIYLGGEYDNKEAVTNINNLEIDGAGYGNGGIALAGIGNKNIRANVTNTKINLTNPFSEAFFFNNGGIIDVANSKVQAGIGIALQSTQDYASENIFNIKNSSLTGQNALLGVNDHRYYPADATEDDAIGDAEVAALQPFTLTADNSTLAGRVYIDQDPSLAPKITFNLNNGTSWLINGNSVLDELNIHDSTVSFSNDGKFKTLKINGDLTGNNSQFNMNTSLADGKSDKIEIHGQVHGQHRISVSDSRKRPKTPNGQVTLVESEGGDGSFSMVQPYVDAGKYRYFFHQNGNNWILSNDNGAASSGGSHHGLQYEISDFANSLISMRQAANQYIYQMQEPLNTRFMRRKDQSVANNLWLDSNYANNHFDSVGTNDGLATSGFKQKSYSLQLGYDHLLPLGNENNQIYLGGLVGQGHSSVDFYGNYKNGNLKALTAGIYAGWNHTSGWFADAAYRYSHLKASASKMDNTTWHSNSFSADVGKDFSLADKWVVTPKAGMTFGRLSGDAYNSSTTFYRSQLGAAVRTSVALNKITLHPYAGAYWLHDKNSLGHAFVDDSNMRIAGAGNSGLYEAGLGMDFNASNHADLKLDYANGQHTEQKFGINLNYRYSW